MLFDGEAHADEMFREAGFEAIEHRLVGPSHDPDIAYRDANARARGVSSWSSSSASSWSSGSAP